MPEQRKYRPLNNVVADMRNFIIDRCKNMIEAARKKPKEKEVEEERGITSRFKRDHGL